MITVYRIQKEQDLHASHAIRKEVFVVEQNCPEDIEWEYEEESTHFIALINGAPAGTARWRKTENGIKLERFAVLQPYRKTGVGQALLQTILADVLHLNHIVYLHAQLSAKGFYLKNNFKPVGPHFWEADIEHVKMEYAG